MWGIGWEPYSRRAFLSPDARDDAVRCEAQAKVLHCWAKKRWRQFLICLIFGPGLTWLYATGHMDASLAWLVKVLLAGMSLCCWLLLSDVCFASEVEFAFLPKRVNFRRRFAGFVVFEYSVSLRDCVEVSVVRHWRWTDDETVGRVEWVVFATELTCRDGRVIRVCETTN